MANFEIENGILKKCSGIDATIVVPDGVTVIGDSAFMLKIGLSEITIPEGVERLEDACFWGCKRLSSITLPSSLKYIGKFAFSRCVNLHTINFLGTKKQWEKIEKDITVCDDKNEVPKFFESDWNFYLGEYVVHCLDGDTL